jgi:hypothetical protein
VSFFERFFSGPVGIWIKIHLNQELNSSIYYFEVLDMQKDLREKPSQLRPDD